MWRNARSFEWRGAIFLMLFATCFIFAASQAGAQEEPIEFSSDFGLEDCKFVNKGQNRYFILNPGHQLILEGVEDATTKRVEITVLNETETIELPETGKVKTRVVEEREFTNGTLSEVSRNFFAICRQTNDVVYFGEDVDIFNPDGTVTHEGQWRAGQPDNDGVAEPGLIMPGTFLLGSRYFQEIAEGIAEDQAEHVESGVEIVTTAGTFQDCVRVVETSVLDPDAESEKVYCPGVGLVVDDVVVLTEVTSKAKRK